MSWTTAIVVVLIVIVLYVLWNDIRYALGLYTPTDWSCTNPDAFASPLRRNRHGDIECMAKDGKNCIYDGKTTCAQWAAAPPTDLKPLACGSAHKVAWGGTGYEDPNHWCATGHKGLPPFPKAYVKKWA